MFFVSETKTVSSTCCQYLLFSWELKSWECLDRSEASTPSEVITCLLWTIQWRRQRVDLFLLFSLGLRVLMSSLLESLPALGNVVVFLLFTIVLFSIIGMQLFNGIYARRCRTTPQPVNGVWNIDTSVPNLCTTFTCPAT